MAREKCFEKVLIVNGWSANKQLWSKAALSLNDIAHDVEILDIDTLEVYENFSAILRKKLKPNTLVIGWSLGTQLIIESLMHSSELSEQVVGLIALQSTPCFLEKEGWSSGYAEEGFNSLHQLCVDNDLIKVKRVFAHLLTQGSVSRRDDHKLLKSEYIEKKSLDQDALLKGLDLLRNNDYRDRLNNLSVTTLWVLGEADTLVPSELGKRLREMGQSQIEVINGMGHFPCGTYWQRVFDSIKDFIEVL